MGKLRGAEVFTHLRAINSGHPGSITTIHADSPELALEQLTLMVMQADLGMERAPILEYVKTIIPVILQLNWKFKGDRVVSDIFFRKCEEFPQEMNPPFV